MSKDMERLTEALEEYAIATNDFDVIAAESIAEGVLESTWLAEHDAKVRAETFREAAQSVHAEARWQAEQKMRGAVQRSGAETAVDRLLVIEKLFHEQADRIEKEAGLK